MPSVPCTQDIPYVVKGLHPLCTSTHFLPTHELANPMALFLHSLPGKNAYISK